MSLDELRIRLAELHQQKTLAESEPERLRDNQQQVDCLDGLPGLIEEYLEDLPYISAMPTRKELDSDDIRRADGKLKPLQRLTQNTVKPRPEVDVEAEALKYRGLYDKLGLKIVKYKEDTLEASWNIG
jgi:hypothetical protein